MPIILLVIQVIVMLSVATCNKLPEQNRVLPSQIKITSGIPGWVIIPNSQEDKLASIGVEGAYAAHKLRPGPRQKAIESASSKAYAAMEQEISIMVASASHKAIHSIQEGENSRLHQITKEVSQVMPHAAVSSLAKVTQSYYSNRGIAYVKASANRAKLIQYVEQWITLHKMALLYNAVDTKVAEEYIRYFLQEFKFQVEA